MQELLAASTWGFEAKAEQAEEAKWKKSQAAVLCCSLVPAMQLYHLGSSARGLSMPGPATYVHTEGTAGNGLPFGGLAVHEAGMLPSMRADRRTTCASMESPDSSRASQGVPVYVMLPLDAVCFHGLPYDPDICFCCSLGQCIATGWFLVSAVGGVQVNSEGSFRYASSKSFLAALEMLVATGIYGVAVDIWVCITLTCWLLEQMSEHDWDVVEVDCASSGALWSGSLDATIGVGTSSCLRLSRPTASRFRQL